MVKFKKFFKKLWRPFKKLGELISKILRKIWDVIAKIGSFIGKALDKIGDALKKLATTLAKGIAWVVVIILVVIVMLYSPLGAAIVSGINSALVSMGLMSATAVALTTTQIAMGLASIALLGSVFGILLDKDAFLETLTNAIKSIGQVVGAIAEGVVDALVSVGTGVASGLGVSSLLLWGGLGLAAYFMFFREDKSSPALHPNQVREGTTVVINDQGKDNGKNISKPHTA